MLVRKVLVPPLMAGLTVVCLLGALALGAVSGSRANFANPLAGSTDDKLAITLSQELEGTPTARDIRAARKPLPERLRLLARHPYFELYTSAQRRFDVPWVLVASVHYQETGFGRKPGRVRAEKAVVAIARQLHVAQAARRGLGKNAARAVARRYGNKPGAATSTAMVIERARAWRLLGAIPKPGTGELATPTIGVVGGCGYFGCPRPGHLHNGVDFLAPSGTPIHAAEGGRIALLELPGASGGYGNFICVQHRPSLASCSAHLSTFAVGMRLGAKVRRGQVIGLVGSTGSSSAPHLHFEVRRGPAACQACAVDPLPLMSGNVPQSAVPEMLSQADAANTAASGRAPAFVPPRPAPVAPAPYRPPVAVAPKAPASAPSTTRTKPPVAPEPDDDEAPPPKAPPAQAPPAEASPVTSSGGVAEPPSPSGGAAPVVTPSAMPPPAAAS